MTNEPASPDEVIVTPVDAGESFSATVFGAPGRRTSAGAASRPCPRRSLEDARRILNAIKDKNGDHPWAPDQIAIAVGKSMSAAYVHLTSAGRDFGPIKGARVAAFISMSNLGKRAVYPGSDADTAWAHLRQ